MKKRLFCIIFAIFLLSTVACSDISSTNNNEIQSLQSIGDDAEAIDNNIEEEQIAEDESKLKAEEEAKQKAEEEAKLKAEEEAKQKAEEEAKLKAEEEAKLKAEQEAKQKAEEEAKIKAEQEAKQKAEEEAKLKAEQEAKKKAEEEAKQKLQVISLTSPVGNGEKATITVKGKPNTTYTIRVKYDSGYSKSKDLNDKTSDSNGILTWTWKVGANTNPGKHQITISGNGDKIETFFETVE